MARALWPFCAVGYWQYQPLRMTHGYKRHGTTDLFAALNVLVRHCVADPQSMKRDGGQA
jgi:hypothetical protein